MTNTKSRDNRLDAVAEANRGQYFEVAAGLSEMELHTLIHATAIDNGRLRAIIARNDAIRAIAQHRLIGIALAEGECE